MNRIGLLVLTFVAAFCLAYIAGIR